MTRGRPPKPASQRRLHGDTRKRGAAAHRAASVPGNLYPPVKTGAFPAPDFLTPAARQEWKRLAAEMTGASQLTALDRPAFVVVTEMYSLVLKFQQLLADIDRRSRPPKIALPGDKKRGIPPKPSPADRDSTIADLRVALFVEGPNGAAYPDPAIKAFLATARELRQLYVHFGLTPGVRLRDKTQRVPAPAEQDAAGPSSDPVFAARPSLPGNVVPLLKPPKGAAENFLGKK